MSDLDPLEVRNERLRVVFRHAPVTISVTLLNAILVAAVLAAVDDSRLLIGWVAAIAAVSAVRWVGGRIFLRGAEPKSCSRWVLFSTIGAMTTGALWGVAGFALFPDSASHQLFLALVIAGMAAGAVTVNASHLPTAAAFIMTATPPLAASFFMQGGTARVSALMVIIFSASLSIIGLAAHRAFGERIRLQLTLDHEHRHLSELNQRLLEAVTQRRMAEATLHQAQKMEAIGHLTGGIAHDFNNLLQVMIGNMDLIQRLGADNPRIIRYAKAAEQAAVRGAELTSSLLTFARRQTLEAELVDINALLREFQPILLRTLGANVRFDIVMTPGLPKCLADPAHFQSALLNLVINARDAMPGGGGLSVTTSAAVLGPLDLAGNQDAKPGRFVALTVRDTGVGMTAEVMAKIFEPFFTTKDPGKGTGLGLSQVYGFARQSGGHVRFVSAPDEGTEATLWLPVAPEIVAVTAPAAVGTNENVPSDRPRSSGMVERLGLIGILCLPQGSGLLRDHVQAFL